MLSAHRRALVAAILPTARVAHLGAAALTLAAAATPTVVTVARGGTDVTTALVVATLGAGAVLGWAVDDPVTDLFAALPVSSPKRLAMRIALVAAVAIVGVTLVAFLIAWGPGLPIDRTDRAPEAAAAAAVAVGFGALAARRGVRAAAPVAVTVGLVAPLLVAAMAYRWPNEVPAFVAAPVHERWWWLAISATAVAVHAGRDGARR